MFTPVAGGVIGAKRDMTSTSPALLCPTRVSQSLAEATAVRHQTFRGLDDTLSRQLAHHHVSTV